MGLRRTIAVGVLLASAGLSLLGRAGPTGATGSLAPLCSEVRASLTLDENGLPPYPGRPAVPTVDGNAIYEAVKDIPSIAWGSYDPWLRQWVMGTGGAVESLRQRLGGIANVCVADASVGKAAAQRQARSGKGWRLLSLSVTGAFDTIAVTSAFDTIAVAGDAAGAAQLFDRFRVARADRERLDYRKRLLVGYTVMQSGCGLPDNGPRFAGFVVDARLRTIDPVLAPLVSARPNPSVNDGVMTCPATASYKSFVLSVDRALFPTAKAVFRRCQYGFSACQDYVVVHLAKPLSLAQLNVLERVSNTEQ